MLLFFYGVLLADIASDAIHGMLAGLGPGRPATTKGLLYAVPDPRGAYPVLVPGDGAVRGMVHEAGSVDLAALDAFEGHECRRMPVAITLADGQEAIAEAYCYLFAPRADFIVIEHGDFVRWLRETGVPPLAG